MSENCSKSTKLASLDSEPSAIALFFLIIPHLSRHGKMMGDPYFIKGLVVPDPFWPDYNVNNITKFLAKISEKTNLKWFRAVDGVLYIHSINYKVHNKGIVRNLGPDKMPSYSNEPTPIISGSAPIASPGEGAGSGTPGATTALYVPGVLSIGVLPKPLITFAGEWKGITEAHMTLWAAKYPLVDIEAKLDDLGDWIKKNINEKGKRGKDARHYAQDGKAFIQRCLLDDQKRLAAHAPAPSPGKPTPEEIKAHNDALRQSEKALLERRKI